MAKNGKSNGRWRIQFRLKEQDPEVGVFRTLFREHGIKEDDWAALAGVSTSTVHNMMSGKTRRPQHLSLTKLAHALGCSYELNQGPTPRYEVEIPIAKDQRKKYRAFLAQKRAKENKKNA